MVMQDKLGMGGQSMERLTVINTVLFVLFMVFTGYQGAFAVIRLMGKQKKYKEKGLLRYAVVIAARNESAVITKLIESIRGQSYPRDLVDIYVVADNCTDNTAGLATKAGATVFERFNTRRIGKGYALNFLFVKIKELCGLEYYDGYFVFDADNLLDPEYITQMNKVFSNGFKAVTSYRNTKNYADSWITAGYGLWFLREAEYMNRPRAYLGISCMLSGTGFVFSSELLLEKGGWEYFLLAEDWEFTADIITKGDTVGYCHDAIYYDEQPLKLGASITQRSRWIKGSMQVLSAYGGRAWKKLIKDGNISCYDLMMGVLPTIVLSLAAVLLNGVTAAVILAAAWSELPALLLLLTKALLLTYVSFYISGLMPLITEWRNIHAPGYKKILYSFTYPFFTLTFLFALFPAIFTNVRWTPIHHDKALSISDFGKNR